MMAIYDRIARSRRKICIFLLLDMCVQLSPELQQGTHYDLFFFFTCCATLRLSCGRRAEGMSLCLMTWYTQGNDLEKHKAVSRPRLWCSLHAPLYRVPPPMVVLHDDDDDALNPPSTPPRFGIFPVVLYTIDATSGGGSGVPWTQPRSIENFAKQYRLLLLLTCFSRVSFCFVALKFIVTDPLPFSSSTLFYPGRYTESSSKVKIKRKSYYHL
jgi:hypothetical protein